MPVVVPDVFFDTMPYRTLQVRRYLSIYTEQFWVAHQVLAECRAVKRVGLIQRERHTKAVLQATTDWYLVVDDDIRLVSQLREGSRWIAHLNDVMTRFPKIGMARPILVPDDHPKEWEPVPPDAGFVDRFPCYQTGPRPLKIGPIGGWRVVRKAAMESLGELPPQDGPRYDHTLYKALDDAGWSVGVLPGLIAHDLGWYHSTIG